MAGEPVRLFLDSAGNGPHATAAAKAVEGAAHAFPLAHGAVRSVVAAADRGATGVPEGGTEPANGAVAQDGEGGGLEGTKDSAVIGEGGAGGGGESFAGAEVGVNGRTGGGGGGGCSGEAAAEEMLAMEREDALARVSMCREALEGWWGRQRAAVEEGLLDREKEAADRR